MTQQQSAAVGLPKQESSEDSSPGQTMPRRWRGWKRKGLALIPELVLGSAQSLAGLSESSAQAGSQGCCLVGMPFSRGTGVGCAQVTAVWQSAELCKLPLLSRLGQRVTQVNRKGCHSKLTSHKPAHTAGFWRPGSHKQPAARREESDLPWGRLEVKTRVDRSCHLWPPTVKSSTASITSSINGLSVCFFIQSKQKQHKPTAVWSFVTSFWNKFQKNHWYYLPLSFKLIFTKGRWTTSGNKSSIHQWVTHSKNRQRVNASWFIPV